MFNSIELLDGRQAQSNTSTQRRRVPSLALKRIGPVDIQSIGPFSFPRESARPPGKSRQVNKKPRAEDPRFRKRLAARACGSLSNLFASCDAPSSFKRSVFLCASRRCFGPVHRTDPVGRAKARGAYRSVRKDALPQRSVVTSSVPHFAQVGVPCFLTGASIL